MKRACVIGWPIEHSRSPLIHGYWLRRYGIDGAYTKEAVRPEDVAAFLQYLAVRGLSGCNVTVPHKEAALVAAAEKHASALAVGAANTLWLDGGRLHAANTDTYGYMTYLAQRAPEWQRRDAPVAILGAGGAARAIVHGFLQAGVGEVRMFNRSRPRAEALAQHFGQCVKVLDWDERGVASRECACSREYDNRRHERPGSLDIDFKGFQPRLRGIGHRLRATRNGTIGRRAHCRAQNRRWSRHAAAPGRPRLREMVRCAS